MVPETAPRSGARAALEGNNSETYPVPPFLEPAGSTAVLLNTSGPCFAAAAI